MVLTGILAEEIQLLCEARVLGSIDIFPLFGTPSDPAVAWVRPYP
jgi:hypothetical protein